MVSNARSCPGQRGQGLLAPPPVLVSVRAHKGGWAECPPDNAAPCTPLRTATGVSRPSQLVRTATRKRLRKAEAEAEAEADEFDCSQLLKRRRQGLERGNLLHSPRSAKFMALLAAAEVFQAGSGLLGQPGASSTGRGGHAAQAAASCGVASKCAGCTFAGSCCMLASKAATRWAGG